MIIEVASNSNPIVCSTPSSIKYGLFDIAGGGVLEAVHFSISIATLGAVVSDNNGGAFITNELSEDMIQFNFSNVKYRGAGVARFLGLCGKLCLCDAKNCSKRLFKLNDKEIIRND